MPRIRSLLLASSFALAGCGSTPMERANNTYLFAFIISAPVWVPVAAVAYTIKSVELSLARSEPKPEVGQTGPGANKP